MYPYKYNTGTYISSVVHTILSAYPHVSFCNIHPTAIRSKLLYLFKSGKRSSRLIKSLVPTCCLTSNLFKNNEIKSLQFIGFGSANSRIFAQARFESCKNCNLPQAP